MSDTAVPQQPVPFEVAAQEGEEEAAVKVLDRVRYTRVFDFVGLVDALTEVREGLEARMRSEDGGEASREQIKKVPVRAKEFEHKRGLKRTRSEITHVDDTDEEVDGEEDEDVMSVDAVREQTQSGAEASTEEAQETTSEIQGDGMIVVDCISQLVGPMMKTNIVQSEFQWTFDTSRLTLVQRLHFCRHSCDRSNKSRSLIPSAVFSSMASSLGTHPGRWRPLPLNALSLKAGPRHMRLPYSLRPRILSPHFRQFWLDSSTCTCCSPSSRGHTVMPLL